MLTFDVFLHDQQVLGGHFSKMVILIKFRDVMLLSRVHLPNRRLVFKVLPAKYCKGSSQELPLLRDLYSYINLRLLFLAVLLRNH